MLERLLDLRLTCCTSAEVLAGVCRLFREHGLPLDRGTLHARQLHPEFIGRTLYWTPDSDRASEVPREHGVEATDAYLKSPLYLIDQDPRTLRQHLPDPEAEAGSPVFAELARAGFTDYVMLPLPIGRRKPLALSLATRSPAGFRDAQIALAERAIPALSTLFDLFEQRLAAEQLLGTYVGRNAGRRVLDGSIRRGDGEPIHAVLLSADLRRFTSLSERLSLKDTITVLNRYFDAVGESVAEQDGEILKFIGDQALVIFPCHRGEGPTCDAAARAVVAAKELFARLDAQNRRLRADGLPEIDAAAALHVGDMMYGNIGAANRLDFTAIGPAVNLVARLQELASRLGERIVVSRQLAALPGVTFRSLGRHQLKGIAEPQEAYAVAGIAVPQQPPAA